MILLAHLLFGAAIGSIVKNMPLAIFLAFLSHYFLDIIPHAEYNIENIEKKQWRRTLPQFLGVSLDFLTGVLFILIFSNSSASSGQAIIYVCAFFAIIPDGLYLLNLMLESKVLQNHSNLHQKKIHFLKHKKIPMFWRVFSQMMVIAISIFLLRS
ncbi:MAG: Uncharacterized protein CEN87_373 [Parcubacteria group bacterium Licking1014_1]|nr:MAG: Uncharacterized protein CEN87_373 [Parcubacteria group bacterium Licking1014_1]